MAAALIVLFRRSDALISPSFGRRQLQSTLRFADGSPRDQQKTRTQKRKASQKLRRSTELERPEIIYSNNHVCVVNKPAGRRTGGE